MLLVGKSWLEVTAVGGKVWKPVRSRPALALDWGLARSRSCMISEVLWQPNAVSNRAQKDAGKRPSYAEQLWSAHGTTFG